jgi:hypothetical protein
MRGKKTYSTRDSLVVTGPITGLALTSLSMEERTGFRVLSWEWPYVKERTTILDYSGPMFYSRNDFNSFSERLVVMSCRCSRLA